MADARLAARQGQAFIVLFAIFLIGAGSGAVAMRAYEHYKHKPGATNYDYGTDTAAAVSRLEKEVGLTPDQIEQVKAILDDSIMHEADLLHQIRAIQDDGRRRILELLDDAQRAKFEDMSERASVQ